MKSNKKIMFHREKVCRSEKTYNKKLPGRDASAVPLIFFQIYVHGIFKFHALLLQEKSLFQPAGDKAAGMVDNTVAGKITIV